MWSKPCYFGRNHFLILWIFIWYFADHFFLINHFSQFSPFVLLHVRVFHYLCLNLEKFLETTLHKIAIVFCCEYLEEYMLVLDKVCAYVFHVTAQSLQERNRKNDIFHSYFLLRNLRKEQKVLLPFSIGNEVPQHCFLFLSAKGILKGRRRLLDRWELTVNFL